MITLDDYFMGRDRTHAQFLTPDITGNAHTLLGRVNGLLSEFIRQHPEFYARVNSGWRPSVINQATPGAAKRSKHMTGEAVDMDDDDGLLDDWCMDNLDLLEKWGLWMEHPSATKGWCHLQSVPPRSGRRVFYP